MKKRSQRTSLDDRLRHCYDVAESQFRKQAPADAVLSFAESEGTFADPQYRVVMEWKVQRNGNTWANALDIVPAHHTHEELLDIFSHNGRTLGMHAKMSMDACEKRGEPTA